MLRKVAEDLKPADVERVERLLRRWDASSEKELIEMLGEGRAKRLLRDLKII